jgi:hypothetical protein
MVLVGGNPGARDGIQWTQPFDICSIPSLNVGLAADVRNLEPDSRGFESFKSHLEADFVQLFHFELALLVCLTSGIAPGDSPSPLVGKLICGKVVPIRQAPLSTLSVKVSCDTASLLGAVRRDIWLAVSQEDTLLNEVSWDCDLLPLWYVY